MIDPTEDEASFVLRLDAIAVVYSFVTAAQHHSMCGNPTTTNSLGGMTCGSGFRVE